MEFFSIGTWKKSTDCGVEGSVKSGPWERTSSGRSYREGDGPRHGEESKGEVL